MGATKLSQALYKTYVDYKAIQAATVTDALVKQQKFSLSHTLCS